MKILILSDHKATAQSLKYSLSFFGYQVAISHSRKESKVLLEESSYDLILIDYNSKRVNALHYYQEMMTLNGDGLLVLMGKNYEELSEADKLFKGRAEILLKPFEFCVLRDVIQNQSLKSRLKGLKLGELKIDAMRSLVFVKDQVIKLGEKELRILLMLAGKTGKIVASSRLLTEERIKSLRWKLRHVNDLIEIQSIRGIGYKLVTN